MNRFRVLSFLVIAFSVLGAASAVLAVIMMATARGESGAATMSPAILMLFLAVSMQGIAAVGAVVSNILKAQAERIEILERQLKKAEPVPDDRTRS
jgi:hypothetical protein